MLGVFKKILGSFRRVDKVSVETLQEETSPVPKTSRDILSSRLRLLAAQDEQLVIALNDPVNKLYILNTYSESFGDLLRNVLNKNFSRQMKAVNLHAFFRDYESNLSLTFGRLADIIDSAPTLNAMVEYDLFEVLEAFTYFGLLSEVHDG